MKAGLVAQTAVLAALTGIAASVSGRSTDGARGTGAPDGKLIYDKQCAVCHGPEGRGDGPAAYLLFPKPRNLTEGVFKIRSTPSGYPPTGADLLHTVSEGIPGSAMPAFAWLAEEERRAVVDYVRQLAGLAAEEESPVIEVPPEPPAMPEFLVWGKQVYDRMKCAECHGEEGYGDGPSARTLHDDWGYAAPPNNFRRGIFKGGGAPGDIYLRFTTGMDGTPMPSFEAVTTGEERWALAHYVRSLSGGRVARQPSTGTVIAGRIRGNVPGDPSDRRWNIAEPTRIPLMLLWQRQEATDEIAVRALHNGKEIALLLEWSDPDATGDFLRTEDFSDAAAVQLSPVPDPPLFAMGEAGAAVNIWYWRYDWQRDLDGFRDIEEAYPGMVADDHLFEGTRYPKSVRGPTHGPVMPAPSDDSLFLSGWAAGNPLSVPKRMSAVQDLIAEGFGTVRPRPGAEPTLAGRGVWFDGRWRVVFRRRLQPEPAEAVVLTPGSTAPIAFAVWDGAGGDRDGQKAVTTWYRLRLE